LQILKEELTLVKEESKNLYEKIDVLIENLELKNEQVEVLERAQVQSLELALAEMNTENIKKEVEVKEEELECHKTPDTKQNTVPEKLPVSIKEHSISVKEDLSGIYDGPPVTEIAQKDARSSSRNAIDDIEVLKNEPQEVKEIENSSNESSTKPPAVMNSQVK